MSQEESLVDLVQDDQAESSKKRKRDSRSHSSPAAPLQDPAFSQLPQYQPQGYSIHHSQDFRDTPDDISSVSQDVARHVAEANARLASAAAESVTVGKAPKPQESGSYHLAHADGHGLPGEGSFATDSGYQHSSEAAREKQDGKSQSSLDPYHEARDAESRQTGPLYHPHDARVFGSPGDLGSSHPDQRPAVGTVEWIKVRKDNHKEVERRRRETINEGINDLAKIIPNCDKNKGAILQRGVEYIAQLKANEDHNINKWTLEKALTDQAIQELGGQVAYLKDELRDTREDVTFWRDRAIQAGVDPAEAPKRAKSST